MILACCFLYDILCARHKKSLKKRLIFMRNMHKIGSRLGWIDCLRGIAILLVLIGHLRIFGRVFPFQIYKFINGFHMPLFFMLAGYLFKQERPFSELIHKIAYRYIIPYFILCGINLLIEIIIHFLLGME